MSTTAPPRSLADVLRGWPDQRLAALLQARPDLASPLPADSAQLAARATHRGSVLRALDSLSVVELAAVEAVAHLAPASTEQVADAVGGDPRPALERAADLALVWEQDDAWRALSVLPEALGSPAGPTDPGSALADLPAEARTLLDHLVATGADGTAPIPRETLTPRTASTPAEHLVARRLLAPVDGRWRVPWSVRRAAGGPGPAYDAPGLALGRSEHVDRAAAGAAFELVRRVELLLDHWGTHPVGVLRSGGLGVRDLRAAATFLHTDVDEAALVLETAHAAGLVAEGDADDVSPAWLPTDGFDRWLALEAAERWQRLATAWLANPRMTALVGTRDDSGRAINALSPGLGRGWLAPARRDVLLGLADTAPGEVLAAGTGVPSLVARLAWLRPRRPSAREDLVLLVLREAAILGVTALDGLSGPGRALIGGDDAAAALAPLLPAPVDHVLLQADLTAVAPGPLETGLAQRLALAADVESRGGATTYRFTKDSVRRALDAGWSAAEVLDFLREASRTPVPQALEVLVGDVARTFGSVRVGAAEAFLRSDDEATLAALLHQPGAAGLRLRRIAPTVLISDVPVATLLSRLRELGAAPVLEAADGTVRLVRPDAYRARTPKPHAPEDAHRVRVVAHAASAVQAVRAGDRAAAHRPRTAQVSSPADVMALLRAAVEAGEEVWIGFVDTHGRAVERVVAPLRVDGGRLTAYDRARDDESEYPVHRITAARRL